MTQEYQTPEQEQKVAEKQAEQNLTQEETKKKVAQESVENQTGKSFEEIRRLAIDIMEAKRGFDQQNSGEAAKEMSDLNTKDIQELQEKMDKTNLAGDLVHAGLGPEFLSTGATTLEQTTKTMAENTKIYGDKEDMNHMIQEASLKNPNLTEEQIKNMSPEELKKSVENPQGRNTASQSEENHTTPTKTETSQDNVKKSLYERLKTAAKSGAEKLTRCPFIGKSKGNTK